MAGLSGPSLADVLDGKAEAHITQKDQEKKEAAKANAKKVKNEVKKVEKK